MNKIEVECLLLTITIINLRFIKYSQISWYKLFEVSSKNIKINGVFMRTFEFSSFKTMKPFWNTSKCEKIELLLRKFKFVGK